MSRISEDFFLKKITFSGNTNQYFINNSRIYTDKKV